MLENSSCGNPSIKSLPHSCLTCSQNTSPSSLVVEPSTHGKKATLIDIESKPVLRRLMELGLKFEVPKSKDGARRGANPPASEPSTRSPKRGLRVHSVFTRLSFPILCDIP